jgi:stage V sporulation protein D (sporulation-specific penicillin-binding protein)
LAGNVRTSRRRLLVVLMILVILMILLIFRVGYWNIVRGADLQAEAEEQWISDTVVMPQRGSILDRNGSIMAQSAAADTVVLLPQRINNPSAVASALAEILEIDKQEILYKASTKTRIDENGQQKNVVEVWLKRQITTEQSERIQALGLQGVKLVTDVKRYYPNRDFAAQVIGYTTLDGEGQTGIEKRYDSILKGRQGRMVAETDKFNNDIPNGQEMVIEPIDGQDVVLTIDEVIQSFLKASCEEALCNTGAENVQGAVMDVTTGEVMAMVNLPEFDLNDPPREDEKMLSELSANDFTASVYEPGSIFSLITAAAAADMEQVRQTYTCAGTYSVDGMEIVCNEAHGVQTFAQAVTNGCKVAGAQMAADMGKQAFYGYLDRFGFGRKTGIDFTTDAAGSVMDIKYASDGDLAKMGAGEGIKVSQMQMLDAITALVNNGSLYTPQLILGLTEDDVLLPNAMEQVSGQAIGETAAAQMRRLMQNQIISERAQSAQIMGYSSAAAYGATQKYDADGNLVQEKELSTFVMYAPADQPRYIAMVTLDGIDRSDVSELAAAPYVRKVLEEILKYANIQPDDPDARVQEKIQVPNVVDMDLGTATATLETAGFGYMADGTGTVTGQTPVAGEEVFRNTVVALSMDFKNTEETIGSADMVAVPNFSGMGIAQARDLAIAAGLRFYAQGAGIARSQYPAYGVNVSKGSAVTVAFQLQLPVE